MGRNSRLKRERAELKGNPWVQALLAENDSLRQQLEYHIDRRKRQARLLQKMYESGKIAFDDNVPPDGEVQAVVSVQEAQASIERIGGAARSSINFMSALGELQKRLGQLEILTVVNGSEKTAAAFGKCGDYLEALASEFERALQEVEKAGVENVGAATVRGLLEYCRTLSTAVDSYVTAHATARPGKQTI